MIHMGEPKEQATGPSDGGSQNSGQESRTTAIWAILEKHGYVPENYNTYVYGVPVWRNWSDWPTLKAHKLRELADLMDELVPLGVRFNLGKTQIDGDNEDTYVIVADAPKPAKVA